VSAATLLIGAGLFAVLPYLTLYLQNDLGYSALQGGLCLLPGTVLCFVVPLASRSRTEHLPPGIVLGAALATTALGLAVIHGSSIGDSWTALAPGLLLVGTGVGLANPAIARIALGVVPPERAGMASGINNTFRIGGVALGVAVLGAVFEHQLTASLRTQLGQPPRHLAETLASGGTTAVQDLEPAQHDIVAAAHEAFASGIDHVLVAGTALLLLGGIAALTLVRTRRLGEASAPAPHPSAEPMPNPSPS
jgi:hypothetical protein